MALTRHGLRPESISAERPQQMQGLHWKAWGHARMSRGPTQTLIPASVSTGSLNRGDQPHPPGEGMSPLQEKVVSYRFSPHFHSPCLFPGKSIFAEPGARPKLYKAWSVWPLLILQDNIWLSTTRTGLYFIIPARVLHGGSAG